MDKPNYYIQYLTLAPLPEKVRKEWEQTQKKKIHKSIQKAVQVKKKM